MIPSPPQNRYGAVARTLHWTMALLLLGMVGFGLWLRSMGYYDPWYHRAFFWHRSMGVTLFGLFLVRLAWRLMVTPPPPSPTLEPWEVLASQLVHRLLYLLMALIPLSGYLLSTADGRPVPVFGWFEIPALLPASKGREEWAGMVHLILGLSLAGLAGLHAMAALKHHFINRDDTLRRML